MFFNRRTGLGGIENTGLFRLLAPFCARRVGRPAKFELFEEEIYLVKVCDAIMGSGKTSATINYINEHPEKRFIYITPYLAEAERIKQACPAADFIEPTNTEQHGFSKMNHTAELVKERRNIASTHKALSLYTPEMYQELKDAHYTVIIDEEVSVVEEDAGVNCDDISLMQDAGYIEEVSPNEFALTEKGKQYSGGRLAKLVNRMRCQTLLLTSSSRATKTYYWKFSKELFSAADEVLVLTYLFDRSEMQMFFAISEIEYTNIGISYTPETGYQFCDHKDYIPPYVANLDQMIIIEQRERLNEVGKNKTSLSMGWYQTRKVELDELRRNIYNYFRNRADGSVDDRMCGTFKAHWGKIRGRGYWNSNVVFSQNATNAYADKTVLAYPVNLFASPSIVNFYRIHGQEFDNDRWALSTMVQWIWRSAIRNGKQIQLYLPSRRMRELLYKWIADTQEEYYERYGKES